jgi:hypothetical protein
MAVFNSLTVLAIHAPLVSHLLHSHCEYADSLEVAGYDAKIGDEIVPLVDFILDDAPYSPFGVELTLLSLHIPYLRYNDRLDGEIDTETHYGHFDEQGQYVALTVHPEDEHVDINTLKGELEKGAQALAAFVKERCAQQPEPINWGHQQGVFTSRTHPRQGEDDIGFIPLVACLDDDEQASVDHYVNRVIQLEGILPEQVQVNGRTLTWDQYLSATPPATRKAWKKAIESVIAAQPTSTKGA